MIKKLCLLLSLGVFVLSTQHLSAQETPILKSVKIDSYVQIKNNLFTFSYRISNPIANTGQISNVKLDISKQANSTDLSAQGLLIHTGVDYEGRMMSIGFEDAVEEVGLSKQLVPVGAQPPVGWSTAISSDSALSWGSQDKKYRILPGQSSGEYTVISRGLPSIRNISVRPKWVLVVKDYVSEADIERSKMVEKEITYYGKTVGPSAPPADFKAAAFLDYIINLKHQAVSLGWIKNEGIANSLDVKLDNAKKKLSDGNLSAVKNILNAFINEVEAQGCATYENCPSGKHLTSEAYALLKYNAQYLIDNLK